MAKKKTKIATTYFVTIISSLILIGGAGYFALKAYFNSDSDNFIKPADGMQTSAIIAEEYVPDIGDCQTVMFIYEPEKSQTSTCFVLARFIPTDNKVVIVPFQSDVCAVVNGKTNTLYEFYRLEGIPGAVSAVENAVNIKVDKYMKFSKDSFTLFSNFMGNISYNVPYNLIHENQTTGESTIIKSGEQMLDAVMLRKVLTFPEYKGGEEYRAKVVGTITTELVNSGANGILHDSLDVVFTDIINSDIETDITRYDYEEKKAAIEYVLNNTASPAQLVLPSGAYNENNCYVLDDNFIEALPRWFGME